MQQFNAQSYDSLDSNAYIYRFLSYKIQLFTKHSIQRPNRIRARLTIHDLRDMWVHI